MTNTSYVRKILFVHNNPTRFVRIDIDLLSARYAVTERYERRAAALHPLDIWRQVSRHDLVYCWFASWHAVFPVIFARAMGKPAVVVVGGYDVACMPEIGYGHQRGGLRRWYSQLCMRSASVVAAFSSYSRDEAINNAGVPPHRAAAIPLGVPDIIGSMPADTREARVLTVGNVNRSNLERKGHSLFVETARFLPNVQFVLAGNWQDTAITGLRSMAPANVTFTGWIEDSRLVDLYRSSSVYAQLSRHEGFGLSAAEAMLAGCVPVTTVVGALPEVVDGLGFTVATRDPRDAADAIDAGMRSGSEMRKAARDRILSTYPLDRRRVSLWQLIDGLLDGKTG